MSGAWCAAQQVSKLSTRATECQDDPDATATQNWANAVHRCSFHMVQPKLIIKTEVEGLPWWSSG